MNVRYTRICSSAVALGMGLLQGHAAWAEGADQASVEQSSGEIIVTAQKRSERLLDVPMSVAAISGEDLTHSAITSTGDLQQLPPGLLTVNNGLAFTPSIRGISSSGTSPGDETNVAVYLDGVYLGTPMSGLFDLRDVERIEVLKGPQGTLFGRNATGGAIQVITRKPSFDYSGEVNADYGFRYHDVRVGAFVTGPLSDKWAFSASANYRTDKGYYKGIGPNVGRTYGGTDNYIARGKLLYQPSEATSFVLSADVWSAKNPAMFATASRTGYNPSAAVTPFTNGLWKFAGSTDPLGNTKGYDFSLDAQISLGSGLDLRSISAYRNVKGQYQADIDRSPAPGGALALRQNQGNFSQELNLTSNGDRFDWVLGAYYYHSDANNPNFSVLFPNGPSGTVVSNWTGGTITDSLAVFADGTYDLTSNLHATAGVRYSWEKKNYHFHADGSAPVANGHTWQDVTYRAVLKYDFTTNSNIYASYSTGFKSGVYNSYSPLGLPVDPEKIKAIEVGMKAKFGSFAATFAAYDYSYDNIQVQGQTPVGSAYVVTLTNAAKAKLRGLEASIDGRLLPGLSINAGFNWMPTARYENFATAQVFIPLPAGNAANVTPYDASGSRVVRAPEWTTNLRGTYETQLGGGTFRLTGSWAHTAPYYSQPGNFSREPAQDIVNSRVEWADAKGIVTYSVWGQNLTNEKYSIYTVSNTNGDALVYAPGRQIFVGLNVKF